MNTIRDKIFGDVFRDMIAEMLVRGDVPKKMQIQHQTKRQLAGEKSGWNDWENDAARAIIAERIRDLPEKMQLEHRKKLQQATARSEGKDAGRYSEDAFWDMQEQSQLQKQTKLLSSIKEALQTGSNSHSTIGNPESYPNDISVLLPPKERGKLKGKSIHPNVENGVLEEQLRDMRERLLAESTKLRATEFELQKLKEVCIDLLDRVDEQNHVILRNRVDLEKASNSHALAQQQIMEHKEKIDKLRKIQVTEECIICMDEFGHNRQRAFWKDCNHANICYKCTTTLWKSNSKKCPLCNTPASSMPTRLPPKIYL